MDAPESSSIAGSGVGEVGEVGEAVKAPTVPKSRPRTRRIWACALAAGVISGLVSWAGGEAALKTFKPELFKVQILLQTFIQPTTLSQNAADLKNATLSLALLGLAVALTMGIAGGIAGGSLARGATVGLAIGTVGALVGGAVSWLLLPMFHKSLAPNPNDLLTPILIHGGIWTAIGAVGGLAFVAALGDWRQIPDAVIGACAGALMGTTLFHAIGVGFFQESEFISPIPASSVVRFLSRMLITVFIAVGAAWGSQSRLVHPAPVAPSDS